MVWSLVVFLGACSYGVLSTIVKFAYDAGYTVDEVIGGQLFFAVMLSWLLALVLGRGKTTKKDWLSLIGVGFTSGSTGILYYLCLQDLSASLAIVMLFQFTWIGLLLEAVVTRTRPSLDQVAAILVLLIGTVLASGVFGSKQHFTWVGLLLGFLSALTYTLFIMFSGRVSVQVSPWNRNAIIMTGGMLLAFLIYPPKFLVTGALTGGLWKYALLLSIFVVISILCMNLGVPRIGATLALILGSAELPTAVFMSRFVLQESVTFLQWLGVAVILVGIVIPEISKRRVRQGVYPSQGEQQLPL